MRYILLFLLISISVFGQQRGYKGIFTDKPCIADTVTFEAEYRAILDYADNNNYRKPSHCLQNIQNMFVKELKAQGFWDSLDILYILANDGSREFGFINWKDTSQYYLEMVDGDFLNPNSIEDVAVHWSPKLGVFYKNYGQPVYFLRTGYNPSVNGINYNSTDASIFFSMYNPSETLGVTAGSVMTNILSPNFSTIYLRSFRVGSAMSGNFRLNNDTDISPDVQSGLLPVDDYAVRLMSRWGNDISFFYEDSTLNVVRTNSSVADGIYPLSIQPSRASGTTAFGAGGSLSSVGVEFVELLKDYFNGFTSTFEPEYIDLLFVADSLGYELPSAYQQIQQDSIIKKLKDEGIWGKLDIFYCLVDDSPSLLYSYLNWKEPRKFQLVPVNGFGSGASTDPGYTSNGINKQKNLGIKGNSVNGADFPFLTTTYRPNLDATNLEPDSASIFTLNYSPSNTHSSSVEVFSAGSSGNFLAIPGTGTTTNYKILTTDAAVSSANFSPSNIDPFIFKHLERLDDSLVGATIFDNINNTFTQSSFTTLLSNSAIHIYPYNVTQNSYFTFLGMGAKISVGTTYDMTAVLEIRNILKDYIEKFN